MSSGALTSVTGLFEASGRAGGHLRSPEASYARDMSDVVVSARVAADLRLRGGELVTGHAESRRGTRELAGALLINGQPVEDHLKTALFEDLTPIEPRRHMHLETRGGSLVARVIDILAPIGFGQRGLIVAPPRTGKTTILQEIARGVAANHPDVHIMVLLIDERPEEVTDMKRNVPGDVVSSSNDRDAESHVRLALLMIERAKRMVEAGRDVIILLDSLTRLGRAFNTETRQSGRVLSGGIDAKALAAPKAVFGAARCLEERGSLTIIATALVGTGSRMDDVIFSEFKGTGNMELVLSADLANQRIWPAIHLADSGTRKEALLLTPPVLKAAERLRRAAARTKPDRAMGGLLHALGKFEDNAGFVKSLS